jgi:hypothetical protein
MPLQRHLLLLLVCAASARAADPAGKDVLLFANGEKLIGRLVRSNSSTLLFQSDSAGAVTVAWSSVQELRTAQPFAVVRKDVKLGRHEDATRIPRGPLSVAGQTITIDSGAGQEPQRVAVKDAEHVLDVGTFGRLARDPGVLSGWKGTVTGGATLVEATQKGRTFTGAIHLSRPVPAESWLQTRNRTNLDFNGAYGIVSQPGSSRLKTELFHAGLEHDRYFSSRFFAFGQGSLDHNFSQGLDLQQTYGGGIGWTVTKRPNLAIDLKGSASYLRQHFQDARARRNLFGSTLAQTLNRRTRHGIVFAEQISITPTFNDRNAYAAGASTSLTIPLYKRFSFTVGAVDTFLNNPAPGFRKNSFQFTTGLSYTLP